MAAAGVTAFWPSIWPDIVVGLGIAALNADVAKEIWKTARREHGAALAGRDGGSRSDPDDGRRFAMVAEQVLKKTRLFDSHGQVVSR
ncbi:MAG: hypothetical protein ACREC1_02360 [Methylovirgula sp.]